MGSIRLATKASPFGLSSGRVGRTALWTDDPTEQVRHYAHWVYAAIRPIQDRVAQTHLRLYRRDQGPTGEIDDPDHPFLRLMERVNPVDTRYNLWARTVLYLSLTGNAYWYVPANRLGVPAEVWTLPSQRMRVIPGKDGTVKGYEHRQGSKRTELRPHEVIHLRYPSPVSDWYGYGPLQAAARSVDIREMQESSQYHAYEQGVHSELAISTEQELTEETVKRLRSDITGKYAGTDKAGVPLILEQGLQAQSISLSPREMAYLQSSKATRDDILSIFGTPAAIAGVSEDVNRNVAEAMELMFVQYTVAPILRQIEEVLTQDLLPRYDERLRCRFEEIVPRAREEDREDARMQLDQGAITINEYRDRQGLPPVEWGDVPYLNLSKGPYDPDAGTHQPPPRQPAPAPPDAEAVTKDARAQMQDRAFGARAIKSLISQERGVADRVDGYLAAQEKRVLRRLQDLLGDKAAGEGLVREAFRESQETERLTEVMSEALRETGRLGAADTLGDIHLPKRAGPTVGEQVPGWQERMDAWLAERKGAEWWQKTVVADNQARLLKTVEAGLAEGDRIGGISQRVRAFYQGYRQWKPMQVARTETTSAFNAGQDTLRDELGAMGVQTRVRWISALDAYTREDHGDAHGQEVAQGEPFNIGGYDARYPGDSGLPPEQVINCRCTTRTVVVD